MKIDYAVMSATSGEYLRYWPSVSRVWKEAIGITPVLLFIDDGGQAGIDSSHGGVCRVQASGCPLYLVALWSRYWMTQLLPGVSLISDVDMMPVNRRYFTEGIEGVPDDKYLHLTSTFLRMPSCYHVARDDTYRRVLGLGGSLSRSCRMVMQRAEQRGLAPGPLEYWGADEAYATERMAMCELSTFEFRSRAAHTRIDRVAVGYDLRSLRDGRYIDAHLPRPHKEHEDEIDGLAELVIEANSTRVE